jgi:hypothetical protein
MAVGILTGTARSTAAQDTPSRPARWEFLVSSGKLIPTGTQRDAIARGGVTAAQLAFVPGPVAFTATLGWARSRDVAIEGRPKLDAFMYDLGAEARAPELRSGAFSLQSFGGAGVGARSYHYRSLQIAATHNLAGYISAGGELGYRRVRLRLEGRNYFTGFKPLDGQGFSDTRNDVVIIAGLRLAPRR